MFELLTGAGDKIWTWKYNYVEPTSATVVAAFASSVSSFLLEHRYQEMKTDVFINIK